ncbi:MAG: alpha-ketoglutarate-dependent dioxygenase AlkB [Mycobacteriaceae bacterium]|nr:alpha-ketoglutarate-dependent dioxygenase AlkB [Mycobacteriaceae bacterium]
MRFAVQGTLFGCAERRVLSDGAWIDVCSGWLPKPDTLFDELVATTPWRAERRPMYDRVVDVPRLLCFYDLSAQTPPCIAELRDRLNDAYGEELGEPFTTAGLCLYRDGNDSVAWHGDKLGRGRTQDTMVAIVSLGATRILALRRKGGGASLRLPQAHGDLLVMGGSCQRTWEHSVPKTGAPCRARISIQFRPPGVR